MTAQEHKSYPEAARLVWGVADVRICISLLLLCICLYLPGLGAFGILDPSDGYYSEGAREMVESGDFLTPHLNYQPWFDKPILTYWLIASSYKLFGVHEMSARLPSALCGMLLIVFIYFFARQFMRRRSALLAAFVLASSPIYLIIGHMALTDMPLCFLVWLATGLLIIGFTRSSRAALWLGYVFMGLGLLCKGPLAACLVALNLGLFCLSSYKSKELFWQALRKLQLFPGILLTLCVALPWYVVETIATNGAFFQHFFLNENINRAMGVVDHKGPFWYYLPVVAGGLFPWALFLPIFLPTLTRIWKRRGSGFCRDQIILFAALSFICVISFFSVLPTKLSTYILPAVPAFALLMGGCLDRFTRLPRARGYLWMGILLVFFTISSGILAIAFGKKLPVLPSSIWTIWVALIACYCVFTMALWRNRAGVAVSFLVASALVSCGVLVPEGVRIAYEQKCQDFHHLIAEVRELKIDPLLVGRRNPSAAFYLRRKIRFLPSAELLVDSLNSSSDAQYLLIDRGSVDTLSKAGIATKMIDQRGHWYLLQVIPRQPL